MKYKQNVNKVNKVKIFMNQYFNQISFYFYIRLWSNHCDKKAYEDVKEQNWVQVKELSLSSDYIFKISFVASQSEQKCTNGND